jgi:hypothetical protein
MNGKYWNGSSLSKLDAGNASVADTVDSVDSTGFGRAYSASYSFGGSEVAITTADFLTLLNSLGAFNQPYWVARGSWAYANNKFINDTGCGYIHLAGSTVEVMGNGTACCTIRIHTPTTSSSGATNSEFIYINNGSSYSPGWRKVWSTGNDGSGSGLDADKIDGKHYFVQDTTPTASATGDQWFSASTGILKIWNGTTWIGINTYN